MQYLVFDDMAQCTVQAVETMLNHVNPERREQALKFRHVFGQFACLQAYVMLAELMHWTEEEARQVSFEYNEFGQPRLTEEWGRKSTTPYFSISHCKRAIAVAVSESPVGVDVESIRNADEALIERTMNEDEQTKIHEAKDTAMAFTELWTRKESLLKMKGTGITEDLKQVLEKIPEEVEQRVIKSQGYVLTLTSTTTD